MSDLFFSSDQHFNQPHVLKYSKRPFENVGEMNKALIDAINKLPKGATFYSVGDWGAMEYISAIREDLAVRLVMGNWDVTCQEKSGMEMDAWIKHWKANGFDEIYPTPVTLATPGASFWLCHKPSERHSTMFNLFGHIHRAAMVKKNGLNVGVDQHRYQPIPLEDVLFWKEAVQVHYDDEEWMP